MLGVVADLWCEILPAFAPRLPGVLILACLRNKQKAARFSLPPPTILGFGLNLWMVNTCGDQAMSERPTDGFRTAPQQRTYVSESTRMCRIMKMNDMSKKKESERGGREGYVMFPHC